jgi:predicted deacetylase
MASDRKLIVSFHDLHPGSRVQCERFLAMLRELGVARASLLVVPRWHGAVPCSEDREFADWLRARVAEGHEVCLHAYVHEATEVTGNAVQRAMGKHYTAGEGEFYQIGEADAAERLREGLRIVRDGCGVPVWGFTAPAWLLSDAARAALAKLGFGYTTRWGRVELLQPEALNDDGSEVGACLQASATSASGPDRDRLQAGSYTGDNAGGAMPAIRIVPAPVLVWSTRAAWRRICSRGWVRLWGAWNRRSPVLRVAVHPVDFSYPIIEASVRAAISRALHGREAARYCDLLPAGTPPLGGGA